MPTRHHPLPAVLHHCWENDVGQNVPVQKPQTAGSTLVPALDLAPAALAPVHENENGEAAGHADPAATAFVGLVRPIHLVHLDQV